MDALFQDFKAAARSLRARKGFVALAVGTLALALGANSSVFGVIHAVLLEQLPYRDPERLAILWNVKADGENEVLSIANFEDYQAGARALDRIAAWFEQGVNLTGEGEPERLFAARVSPGFFEVLGARPALGRTFGSADHDGGGAHVAVLGDALWRGRFGGDPAVIGRTLRLGDDSYEVVGVMAPGFFFPGARADLALPLDLATEPRRARRDNGFLRVVARLASGVTRAQAERQMSEIARELRARYPETNSRQMAVSLPPLADELVGAFRSQLRLLQAAVGLVVLIACLNLAMLLLASASGRSREMAVKSALGASRGRLARQLFFESLALAAGGGLLGALVGVLGTRALVALSPAQVPRLGGAHFGFDLPGLHPRRRRAHRRRLRSRPGALGLQQLATARAGRWALLRRAERSGCPPGAGRHRGRALAHAADRGRPDGDQLRPAPSSRPGLPSRRGSEPPGDAAGLALRRARTAGTLPGRAASAPPRPPRGAGGGQRPAPAAQWRSRPGRLHGGGKPARPGGGRAQRRLPDGLPGLRPRRGDPAPVGPGALGERPLRCPTGGAGEPPPRGTLLSGPERSGPTAVGGRWRGEPAPGGDCRRGGRRARCRPRQRAGADAVHPPAAGAAGSDGLREEHVLGRPDVGRPAAVEATGRSPRSTPRMGFCRRPRSRRWTRRCRARLRRDASTSSWWISSPWRRSCSRRSASTR